LNQELFDKLFGAGTYKFESKIKEDAETNWHNKTKKLGDVTEFLIESTKFDLS
jgi:hypothetical protein